MWNALIEGLGQLFSSGAASGATSAASSGGGGLMDVGLGSELGIGGAGASANGLGGLSAGLAPGLGGQVQNTGPMSGLMNTTGGQGGMMDMSSLMATPSTPNTGGHGKGNKYQNEQVDAAIAQGMEAGKSIPQNDLFALMSMMGRMR